MQQAEEEKIILADLGHQEEEKIPQLDPSDPSHKASFVTPLNKIKLPLSESKLNVCLFLTGTFCPIHNNHIRALEKSKEQLEASGYSVIGGFICPTHETSLKKKFNKSLISYKDRLALIKLAVKDSDWINVDPFLIYCKSNVGVVNAKSHLEDVLREQIQPGSLGKIQVWSIGGDDEPERYSRSIKKETGKIVIVQNRPDLVAGDRLTDWLESSEIKDYQHKVFVVKDTETPYSISSTKLREMIQKGEDFSKYVPKSVHEYIIQHKLHFGGVIPQESKPKETKPKDKTDDNFSCRPLNELIEFECKSIPWNELQGDKDNSEQDIVLGKGLSAKVFAMKWKDQLVAVKSYLLQKQKKRTIATFTRDLRALVSINHKNVVKCLGAGTYKNYVYIVMERAQPFNLWTYLQTVQKYWPMGLHPICWIKAWAELAEGLQAMSDAGVLHRDLQGNNILIFFEGMKEYDKNFSESPESQEKLVLKITDFGVSAIESDKGEVLRGSMRHYSPEAIEDKMNYVPASDVYSFALLLMEIMLGKRVWGNCTVADAGTNTLAGKRPEFDFPCYDEVREVIELCWKQDPRERPTFGEAAKMLHKVYEKLKANPPDVDKILARFKEKKDLEKENFKQVMISKNKYAEPKKRTEKPNKEEIQLGENELNGEKPEK